TTARIWDANTGLPVSGVLTHEGYVWSAQFSPDGQRVVTASYDKTARVWDANTGKSLRSLKHEGVVLSAQFSLDGQRVFTWSEYKTARVWDAKTGQALTGPFTAEEPVWIAQLTSD